MDGIEALKREYLEMRDEYKGIETFKLVDAAFEKVNKHHFDLIMAKNINGTNKLKYNKALKEFQRAINNFKKMIMNSTAPNHISHSPGSFHISINRTMAFPKSPRVQGRQSMRQSMKTSALQSIPKSPSNSGSMRPSTFRALPKSPRVRATQSMRQSMKPSTFRAISKSPRVRGRQTRKHKTTNPLL
jgi:hypothetical protein